MLLLRIPVAGIVERLRTYCCVEDLGKIRFSSYYYYPSHNALASLGLTMQWMHRKTLLAVAGRSYRRSGTAQNERNMIWRVGSNTFINYQCKL